MRHLVQVHADRLDLVEKDELVAQRVGVRAAVGHKERLLGELPHPDGDLAEAQRKGLDRGLAVWVPAQEPGDAALFLRNEVVMSS